MGLSHHDKLVFKVSKNLLKKGSEVITVGDRVKDRLKICSTLKKQFPDAKIFTYFKDYKLEFTKPKNITILSGG